MDIYLPIAGMAMSLPLLLAVGLGVGVLSGAFGIGGGFILTPILLALGVPAGVAVGTGASLVTASSISSAAGHYTRGNVDTTLGLYLIAGGVFGAISGVKLQQLLARIGQLDLFTTGMYVVLLGVIGTLMLVESVRALTASPAKRSAASQRRPGQHTAIQRLPFKRRFQASKLYMSTIPPVALGATVGWLTAIMGVGGGFMLVPGLIYILHVPTRIALGTSAFQIIFITMLATLLQATQNFSVDLLLAAPLIAGGVIGAQLGILLAQRLRIEVLRAGLAGIVVLVAIRMAFELVREPGDIFSFQAARPV